MGKLNTRILYNREGKLKSIWWVVIFFLILFCFLFPLILLSQHFHFEITLWHQVLIILAVSVICQALGGRAQAELAGRIDKKWLAQLSAGMVIGALLMIFPALLLLAVGAVRWELTNLSFAAAASGILVIASAVLAEELLFRGFIFQRLIHAFGTWPAQLIIGFMFVLTHLNNPGMAGTTKMLSSVNIFIASVLFGVSYIATKRLAMPIGIHLMANFVQGTVLGFGVSGNEESGFLKPVFVHEAEWFTGGDFGLEASAPGLFFVVVTCICFYYYLERNTTSLRKKAFRQANAK
ncbi:MAG TPA: CPBP family intramembrane glutamic endopeptidase [Chryseosolibacter sp.]|nr:CPBP family intramembrane glutamic endopeptidase [Chryseosolibacter sp.]